jgi:hypothetical protein
MPAKRKASASAQSSATIGFEAKLWLTAGSEEEMTHLEKRHTS